MNQQMEKEIMVIIPAFNEEKAVGKVVRRIPRDWVKEVIVVNNASTDKTGEAAEEAGATVIKESRKGYGYACLRGMAYVAQLAFKPDIIVFLDADYSDHPEELPQLVKPILVDGYDMVIGSRALGNKEKGSMTPQQIFGNWLATRMLRWIYGYRFTDLGPFRAVKYDALLAMNMRDKTYGWTVEMQIKAAKLKMKCTEVAVAYRRRIGVSKVSGTFKGTFMAGYKIITTLIKYA